MVLAIEPKDVDATLKALESTGEKAYVVGRVIAGEKGVKLI